MNLYLISLTLFVLTGFIFVSCKERKYLSLYVIAIVLFLPKINIFSLSAESKAGLRCEDIIIACFMLYTFFVEKCASYKKVFSNLIFKFFLAYLACSVISFFVGLISKYTYSLSLSVFGLLRKVEYFCFIFVGYDFYHFNKTDMRATLKKVLNVFTIFTAIISLFQVWELLGSFRFGGYDPVSFLGTAVGTFNGHYELGAFFVFAAIIYFHDILNKIDDWLNYPYFIICMLLILLSKSRTSLLVVLLILVFMMLIYCGTKMRIATIIASVCGVALIIFLIKFTNFPFLERFKTLQLESLWYSVDYYFKHRSYDEYLRLLNEDVTMELYVIQTGDVSFNTRMFKWMAMIDVLTRFPLFGYGFGSNSTMDGSYIKMLAENGLVGFSLFLLLFAVVVRESLKCNGKERGYVVWIVISLFFGAVLIDLFEASKIMEFVWFIVGAYCVRENTEKNKKVA